MARYANVAYLTQELADSDGSPLGLWTPQMQGLAAWTMDPVNTSTGLLAPVGQVHLMPLIPPADAIITTMRFPVTSAATTPTANQCFCGIYDQSGNLIGVTADISGLLTSIGERTPPLTASLAIKAGGFYYAAFLQNAATGAQIRGGYNSVAASMGPGSRFLKTQATNLTAMPNPLGAVQTGTHPLLIGVN